MPVQGGDGDDKANVATTDSLHLIIPAPVNLTTYRVTAQSRELSVSQMSDFTFDHHYCHKVGIVCKCPKIDLIYYISLSLNWHPVSHLPPNSLHRKVTSLTGSDS